MRRRLIATALTAATFLAACGSDAGEQGAAAAPDTTETMSESTETMSESTETMSESTEMSDSTEMAMAMAPWQQLSLTDVDGVAFTLAEFMGKPVFVENFATWCPNCHTQLGKTEQAAAELGEDAVFLALSVETDLDAADVKDYAEENGFTNIRFAVMTPEFLAAMSEAYGNPSVTPPSTPHFVIDSHGVAGELVTGGEDAEAIVEALHAAAM